MATTGPVPFVVISILSFLHSWLITRVATRVIHAGATCKAGTVYISGASEFTTGLAQPFTFCVMFRTCRSLFVLICPLLPLRYIQACLINKGTVGQINREITTNGTGPVVAMIVWLLYLQLTMQSVSITTNIVRSNLDQGEVYNIMW
jgi:hypothetical protein